MGYDWVVLAFITEKMRMSQVDPTYDVRTKSSASMNATITQVVR